MLSYASIKIGLRDCHDYEFAFINLKLSAAKALPNCSVLPVAQPSPKASSVWVQYLQSLALLVPSQESP